MLKKRKLALLLAAALTISTSSLPLKGNETVNISIDATKERAAISPYVYGVNEEIDDTSFTARRMGGNRLTGYNWENNYSNAGSDWNHSSDEFMVVPGGNNEPGSSVTHFHDEAMSKDSQYSLVTLPMAGYVSKDNKGTVSESEVAPSNRWVELKNTKGAPFSLTPDLNDNYVYNDELVNFLVKKYGKASSSTGIKGYSLDNEPSLWSHTHARLHPKDLTCKELIEKTVDLSKAVKKVDSSAEIFGPVLYGFTAYYSLQDASDWENIKNSGGYSWFLDYYLEQMKKESEKSGKKLLDVLDLHWYTNAKSGDKEIIQDKTYDDIKLNKARIQNPRTLWDTKYKEDSWITEWFSHKLPVIPKLKESINKYYPGTKLAFTEYNFGGGGHISGGIAQADTLGIFGKYGVYFASYWKLDSKLEQYASSAFNIYTNYDGKNSKYGNTKVKADTSNIEDTSVYASIEDKDDSKLHMILINKNYDDSITTNININSNKKYKSGKVYAFDKDNVKIKKKKFITNINDNKTTYEIPPLTVCHIIFDEEDEENGSNPDEENNDENNDNPTDTKVTFEKKNEWNGGFIGAITIKNNSNEPIKNWKLEFDYEGTINNLWSGQVQKSGDHYTITPLSWNNIIQPNQSIEIGFGSSSTGQPKNLKVTY